MEDNLTTQISKILKSFNKDRNKVSVDSRQIEKGDVFVAISGVDVDGHDYVEEAIKNGAKVILSEKQIENKIDAVKYFTVQNTRKALALLASELNSNVHKKLKLIAVTGTNGKTSTTEMIYQILVNSGKNVGLISTIAAKTQKGTIDTGYHVTTPDSLLLHSIFRKMHSQGCEYVVLETTSHGFDQYRTYGLEFIVGAITNITPEHLDYHKTMREYILAKAKIFEQSNEIILNKYDPSLSELQKILGEKSCKIVDFNALEFPSEFKNMFPGEYNLENGAIAAEVCKVIDSKIGMNSLKQLTPAEGRMQRIPNNLGLDIIIDFAHDHVSLEKLLVEVNKFKKGKLIHVFGSAGLRDKKKRPKMGLISSKYSDYSIITAEDPRTENLDTINAEIIKGFNKDNSKDYETIKDRQDAISKAIRIANRGDIVLITGKGHEKSMCFGTKEYPWSDKEAVLKALNLSKEKGRN